MDPINLHTDKPVKRRSRYYSSMTPEQYEDYFGEPPKAPVQKPVQDVDDIPPLTLEEDTEPSNQSAKKIYPTKLIYKIQPIPEVEGSDNNSITFHYPQQKFQFSMMRLSSKLEIDGDEIEEIKPTKRQRYRPRSYSENSSFIPTTKFKIIDFLNSKNKNSSTQKNMDQNDQNQGNQFSSGIKRVKKE